MLASSSLPALLSQFQARYPMGCLSAELLTIHQEQYVIRALIQVGGITIATAMAADSTLETAEDRAKLRVLETVISAASPVVLPPILPANPEVSLSSIEHGSQLNQTHRSFSSQTASQPDRLPEPQLTPTAASQSQPDYLPTSLTKSSFSTIPGTETADLSPGIESVNPPTPFSSAPNLSSNIQLDTLDTAQGTIQSTVQSTMPSSQPDWDVEFQSVSQLNSKAVDQPVPISPVPTSPVTSSLRTSKAERASKQTAELPVDAPVEPTVPKPADRSEEIMRIGIEMKRLGWSTEQGREYLKRTYGKASRSKLDDAELLDFLRYLELQSSPLQTPF